jgi:hypothetical protein
MLPYLQAIRHAAVTMPIKNPHQVEQRHHGKTTAKITPAIKEK